MGVRPAPASQRQTDSGALINVLIKALISLMISWLINRIPGKGRESAHRHPLLPAHAPTLHIDRSVCKHHRTLISPVLLSAFLLATDKEL